MSTSLPQRENVDAEKKKDKRQFGELVCKKAQYVQQEVKSVPESLLRQSVSTTVRPAVGEKHFRGGKQRKQGGKKTCGCISQGLLITIFNMQDFFLIDKLVYSNIHTAKNLYL